MIRHDYFGYDQDYDYDEAHRCRALLDVDGLARIGQRLRVQHQRGMFRDRLTAQVRAAGVALTPRVRAVGCPRFALPARWDDGEVGDDLPF